MSSTKLSVRINPVNLDHHLQNNHGTWWCHLTLHHGDGAKQRQRVSLHTSDIAEARRRRDELLASYTSNGAGPQSSSQAGDGKTRVQPETFFKPAELAALAQYLHKRELLPRCAKRFYPCETVDPLDWNEEEAGIVPVLDYWKKRNDLALDNAVARICLSGIQDSLPQWAACDSTTCKVVILGREIKSLLELPPRVLLCKHLLTINWADSGPGYSWPEAYYATELPYFDVVVVTASNDSPDATGYCDLAIGWFKRSDNRRQAVADIIKGHWSHQDSCGQQGWAYLLDTGEVAARSAIAWARQVWAEETADEA